jgi:RNA polymerase sigma-54 factor
MAQGNKLTQQQLLRQRLVPQQVRFVRMLEKTDSEVEEEIRRELDENPALTLAESSASAPTAAAPVAADPLPAYRYRANNGSTADDDDSPEPVAAEHEQTLHEALLAQLAEQPVNDRQRLIAAYIIGAIDNNGYMTRTVPQLVDDIALETGGTLEPEITEVRAANVLVRSLDPAGVGAMDLRDCLLLQVKRLDATTPHRADALEVLTHYFDIFSTRNFRRLAAASRIDLDSLRAANDLITSLNPKPGAAYASDPTQSMGNAGVTPDFVVETDGERVSVSMPNSLPELQIEESFRVDSPGAEGEFIRDRRAQGNTFIEMLRRRADTLMRIVRAIVEMQTPFFLNADSDAMIRPMVLRDVAKRTGLDLTVISRATAGKWLATPLGVYPLKKFFNSRGSVTANGDDADDVSAHEIRAALSEIVDSEDKSSPLSDDALAAALTARGYKVARRTVAKYRTALSIPAARLRRQL